MVFNKYINQNSFIYKSLSQKGHLRSNINKASAMSLSNMADALTYLEGYPSTTLFYTSSTRQSILHVP